jgi:hypothetical protein
MGSFAGVLGFGEIIFIALTLVFILTGGVFIGFNQERYVRSDANN